MDKNTITISTYNKIASLYDKAYPVEKLDIKHIKKFISLIPKGGKILDVGCGTGTITKQVSEKGFYVEGIDLSEGMLKQARKNLPEVTFKKMDMRKLDYPDKSFDALLVTYSLIHIPSYEIPNTIKGFYRVLKSGGIMMIFVQKGKPDKLVEEPLMPGKYMFFNFFTKERLSNYLQNAEFKIIYQREEKGPSYENVPSNYYIYIIAKKVK